MILSWEDVVGGATILSFLIWLGLTGLFYLVCYVAALNTVDDKTQNHPVKIPLLLLLAPISGFFMALFNYNPTLLFILMAITNFYRVRNLNQNGPKGLHGLELNKPLFYAASYLYILGILIFASWFQLPVELEGMTKPLWKSWIDNIH